MYYTYVQCISIIKWFVCYIRATAGTACEKLPHLPQAMFGILTSTGASNIWGYEGKIMGGDIRLYFIYSIYIYILTMYICTYICILCYYVHMYICIITHIYIYTFIYIHRYLYIYMYICIHVYTYIYMYIHTYIIIQPVDHNSATIYDI